MEDENEMPERILAGYILGGKHSKGLKSTWVMPEDRRGGEQYVRADIFERLQAENIALRGALENLVFTAKKMWDEVKPIKDSNFVTITHPIILEAESILNNHKEG